MTSASRLGAVGDPVVLRSNSATESFPCGPMGISGLVDRMGRCHWADVSIPGSSADPASRASIMPARPPRPRPGQRQEGPAWGGIATASPAARPAGPVITPTTGCELPLTVTSGLASARLSCERRGARCSSQERLRLAGVKGALSQGRRVKCLVSGWIRRPCPLKIGTVLRFAPGSSLRRTARFNLPAHAETAGSATRSPPSR
jgi:hypothetical protein